MMALQGPFSTMEVTNGNYEPMNGRLGSSRGIFGSGTFSEGLVTPQITETDRESYPCRKGMEEMLMALNSVEKLCTAMMERLKTPEGPGTSQSDVSQCSTENTSMKNSSLARGADKFMEKKKEKFVPPVAGQGVIIDLTSEDSCDTGTSRRRADRDEPEDAGQVQSSPLATSMATGITIQLSDDDEDDVNEKEFPSSHAFNAAPEAKVDYNGAAEVNVGGDPLQHVWENLKHVQTHVEGADQGAVRGGVQGIAQGPILADGVENDNTVKRRKVNNGDDVSHNVTDKFPQIPWCGDANEVMHVGSLSMSRPKRGRGRPRKEDSSRGAEPVCRDLLEDFLGTSANVDNGPKLQVDVAQVIPNKGKEKKAGKGEECTEILQEKKKGKRKLQDAEELIEDEVDEEEEDFGKPVVSDLAGELNKLSSKLNNEKVAYEPYVRRNYKEDEDEDDLAVFFSELQTLMTSRSGLSSESSIAEQRGKDEGVCDHTNFDYDPDVGYYCEDCGMVDIEMPTQNKGVCSHKNYEFQDETGIYCPDCGKVLRDIQNHYVASDIPKALRKQGQRNEEKVDGRSQVQLNLQGSCSGEDCHGAALQLHPFFEEKMHPHQKKGFKFLTEHLLGGQQGSSEAMGCVLAHAPGTGKTFLVISFIQSFLSMFPHGRPLILAPKIMLQSWVNEFEHWKVQEVPIYRIGASTCGNFRGDGGSEDDDEEEDARLAPQLKNTMKETRAKQLQAWQSSRGVLLMSYKLFTNLVTNGLGENVLPESLDYQMSKVLLETPNLVILDEGHLARNENAQITKALLAMETKRKVVLSGTLFQNNFKELYTILKLCRYDFMTTHPQYGRRIAEVTKNSNGSSCYVKRSKKDLSKERMEIEQKILMQIEQRIFTDEIGDKLEHHVRKGTDAEEIEPVVLKLQSLTRFVDWYPGEILKSLPGLYEYSVHLHLTEFQAETMKTIPRSNYMTRQCAVLAACIHPCLVNRGDEPFSTLALEKKEAHKGVKITFLLQLMAHCKMAQEKLLIFCSTLEPLNYIDGLFCKEMGWQSGLHVLHLDGKMQDSDRQRVIVEFNDFGSQSQVLLASTKACKEGITLVGASRVVILDCPDNPSVVRQAVSRAFRIGQKRKVYVYRLVARHEDEEIIFRRSVNKERLSQVLLDPVSTIGRMRGFLQEQGPTEIEDHLLKKMMLNDREQGKNRIDEVYRYNALG